MPSFRLSPVPISPIVTGNHCRISPGLLVVGAGFSPATLGLWPSMFLTPPNKSNTLHYLRLDSGVLRVVLSRLADCAKCAYFLGVERRLFRLPAVSLISRCIGLVASDPESKPLEEVKRLIKPQGGAEFVTPFYETGKPPVARLLSGAACCQAAIRCCSFDILPALKGVDSYGAHAGTA